MNILLINGSPRLGGNTHSVVQCLQSMLEETYTVEVLNICQMKLSGCLACDGCKANGGHCVCPDESDFVIQKIAEADAVIFGTPVYWWGMSAQLKMVVDKFYSRDAAFHSMKKKIGVVAIGANTTDNPQYRLIHEQFRCIAEYLNWELAFTLSFAAYEPGEVMKEPSLQAQLREAVASV